MSAILRFELLERAKKQSCHILSATTEFLSVFYAMQKHYLKTR